MIFAEKYIMSDFKINFRKKNDNTTDNYLHLFTVYVNNHFFFYLTNDFWPKIKEELMLKSFLQKWRFLG